MTLDDFIAHWTGKPVDFDGWYGPQCMDLMHQYVYDVLNLTDKTILGAPTARAVFENFATIGGHQYFTKVANVLDDLNNYPKPGDIIIHGQPYGMWKDPAGQFHYDGHIAIVVSADGNKFTSFDQNMPEGSKPHLQEYANYVGVLGWLSPIPQQPQLTVAQVQDQLNKVNTALTQCTSQEAILSKQATDAQNDKQALQVDFDALQLKYAELQNEIVALNTEIASFTNNRMDYAKQLAASQDATSKVTEYFNTAAFHTIGNPGNKPIDQIASEIMLKFSQQTDTINNLQNQLKRYNDIKRAIDPVTKQSFWQPFKSIFVTQKRT